SHRGVCVLSEEQRCAWGTDGAGSVLQCQLSGPGTGHPLPQTHAAVPPASGAQVTAHARQVTHTRTHTHERTYALTHARTHARTRAHAHRTYIISVPFRALTWARLTSNDLILI